MRFVFAFILLISVFPSDQNFQIISDIQYCTGGGQPLLMDARPLQTISAQSDEGLYRAEVTALHSANTAL
jgi:hypothetical protein